MNFVLIPGAWMGAWVWEPVGNRLRRLGHSVYPITLSGLLSNEDDISSIGLSTHVNDVLTLLESANLQDVILVGHSYSGIVAGQAAERAQDRVIHTIYIEAFLPEDGKSMLDVSGLDRDHELELIAKYRGRWPAPDAEMLRQSSELNEEQIQWLQERFVGHPGRTIFEPAVMRHTISELQATYIGSEMPAYQDKSIRLRKLDAGHWPMVSVPDELAALLAEIASGYE
jgi:pimeloyl-ACP methyl ester carboxylesterase